MPNWVYNDIEVEGKPQDVNAFLTKAAQVNEWNESERYMNFSFTNFVAPGDEVDYDKDWYEWNVNHWGVKWDVRTAEINLSPKEDFVLITFETAWSIPVAAFEAIATQHPELEFTFKCIEEQGWGAHYSASDPDDEGVRSLITEDEWDIPENHNEWVKRDGECRGCIWDDDPESRYKDCPPIEAEDE